MESVEVTLEDGTSVRWVVPTPELTDEVIEALTGLLGPPDTRE